MSTREMADVDGSVLGRAAAQRFRRPGPPLGRPRPPLIGSLASASTRFAAGVARTPEIRRNLQGPAAHQFVRPAALSGDIAVRPPRWWLPSAADQTATVTQLPPRGLRTIVRSNISTSAPGRIAETMVATPVRVRRHPDVVAAGPMLTQRERANESGVSRAQTSIPQNSRAQAPLAQTATAQTARGARPPGATHTPGQSPGGAVARPAPSVGVGASSPKATAQRKTASAAASSIRTTTGSPRAWSTRSSVAAASVRSDAAVSSRTHDVAVRTSPSSAPSANVPSAPLLSSVALRRSAFGLVARRSQQHGDLMAALPRGHRPASSSVSTSRAVAPASTSVLAATPPMRNTAFTASAALRAMAARFAASREPQIARSLSPVLAQPTRRIAAPPASATSRAAIREAEAAGGSAMRSVSGASAAPASSTVPAPADAATPAVMRSTKPAAFQGVAAAQATQSSSAAHESATHPAAPTTANPEQLQDTQDSVSTTASSQSAAEHREHAGVGAEAARDRGVDTAIAKYAPSIGSIGAQVRRSLAQRDTAFSLPRAFGPARTIRVTRAASARPFGLDIARAGMMQWRESSAQQTQTATPRRALQSPNTSGRDVRVEAPGRTTTSRPLAVPGPAEHTQHQHSSAAHTSHQHTAHQHTAHQHTSVEHGAAIARSFTAGARRLPSSVPSGRSPFAALPHTILHPAAATTAAVQPGALRRASAAAASTNASASPRSRAPHAFAEPATVITAATAPNVVVRQFGRQSSRSRFDGLPEAAGISSSGSMLAAMMAPVDIRPATMSALPVAPARTGPVQQAVDMPDVARSTVGAPASTASTIRPMPIAPPRGAGGSIQRTRQTAAVAENRGAMAAETENAIRRSLLGSGAFDRGNPAGSAAVPAAMAAPQSHPDFPTVRRSLNLGSRTTVQRADGAVTPVVSEESFDVSRMRMRDFQRLVDAVVEALEQRVIDELERRGRRHPGVF